jgi:hypothetical protein
MLATQPTVETAGYVVMSLRDFGQHKNRALNIDRGEFLRGTKS